MKSKFLYSAFFSRKSSYFTDNLMIDMHLKYFNKFFSTIEDSIGSALFVIFR